MGEGLQRMVKPDKFIFSFSAAEEVIEYRSMTTLTVNLPDALTARAQTQALEAGFASLDAYLASLIESDAALPLDVTLEEALIAGVACEGREISVSEWQSKQQALRDSHTLGAVKP